MEEGTQGGLVLASSANSAFRDPAICVHSLPGSEGFDEVQVLSFDQTRWVPGSSYGPQNKSNLSIHLLSMQKEMHLFLKVCCGSPRTKLISESGSELLVASAPSRVVPCVPLLQTLHSGDAVANILVAKQHRNRCFLS